MADAEIRLDLSCREPAEVPAIFRAERDANFVIRKFDKNKFRSQFFCHDYQQPGTGHQVFDDVGLCVITTLQVQADHEAEAAESTGLNTIFNHLTSSRKHRSYAQESY